MQRIFSMVLCFVLGSASCLSSRKNQKMFHADFAWKFSFHDHGDKFSNGNDFALKDKSQFAREGK